MTLFSGLDMVARPGRTAVPVAASCGADLRYGSPSCSPRSQGIMYSHLANKFFLVTSTELKTSGRTVVVLASSLGV
jgi:hypothetical protein